MKKLLLFISLITAFSCGEANQTEDNQKDSAELKAFEALASEEEGTKKFIEDYLAAVNSPDWQSRLPEYLQPNPEKFLEEHAAFRESFPNYQSTIKHLTVDGNKGIVWINITANYSKEYAFESENDAYGDSMLNDIKAENQELSWDETWYFDVVDGKFGTEWDFLKDNYSVLKSLQTGFK